MVKGILWVHSAPFALRDDIERVVGEIARPQGSWPWTAQPAAPGQVRAEIAYLGPAGASAEIASALAHYRLLRFEVCEEQSAGCDGVRYSHTPTLGLFAASVSGNGDLVIPEQRLKDALDATAHDGCLRARLRELLGQDWDRELERFRRAAVRHLAAVS
jgi:Protein of unknown function (DUF3145)